MTASGLGSDPESWVSNHGDYLHRYAMSRLHSSELAEDIVQETFVAAIRARESFAGHSSERTWLVGILKHKIADHFRRNIRLASFESIESLEGGLDEYFDERGHWKFGPRKWNVNPAALLQDKQFLHVLNDCLSVLPVRLAQVFTLREMEAMETEQVCNILRISATNLYAMLHRARFRLRRCLEINWFGKA
jgi:RNA polymerase sigma-70 factor, ECF subfamily